MRRRVLWLGTLVILLLGSAASTPAAPNGAGISSASGGRSVRVSAPPRHRSRASSFSPEFLDLPRPAPAPGPVEISAAGAILMDAETGEVLFERDPDSPRPPASITKILTALVILERGRLTDTVVVSQAAARIGGYRLGLRAGQRISLEDLLAAILIRSANDAAVAAAEHVGRGLSGFVALMNAKAQELGMRHSHFANPHGLDEPDHFTTARDMALLTRVALERPGFARLVRAREAALTIWQRGRRGLRPQGRVIQSHNKLLGRLEGADGVKTGYTDAAGQCLVASASRNGQRMIAVLLNDPNRWTDAATLLEFGFGSAGGAARARTPGRPWRAAVIGGGRG
ncbi:MAG: D-alanyl-D-alanine carboxypeptidase [candidate division NC10 bacterium]|nr:D-alanyl-D-alanine carboxypeptidase [candidate division NC10 bacterium]